MMTDLDYLGLKLLMWLGVFAWIAIPVWVFLHSGG